jgi:hypothetical protein
MNDGGNFYVDQAFNDLEKSSLPTWAILNKARFLDDSSRLSSSFNDALYLPFYYHLGRFFQSKRVLNFGFGLGLEAACYLKALGFLENFVAFREKKKDVYYSPKIGRANLLLHGKIRECHFLDDMESFKLFLSKQSYIFDLCLLTEEFSYSACLNYLNISWENSREGGLIVIDHIISNNDMNRAYFDFCKSQNQEATTFNTRYGIGVIQR